MHDDALGQWQLDYNVLLNFDPLNPRAYTAPTPAYGPPMDSLSTHRSDASYRALSFIPRDRHPLLATQLLDARHSMPQPADIWAPYAEAFRAAGIEISDYDDQTAMLAVLLVEQNRKE